jgi:biotin synthase
MMVDKITNYVLENKIGVSFDEAVELAHYPDKNALYAAADLIRNKFCGADFDTCSVINARSGLCGEDCKWCAQSINHKTDIPIYPLLDADTVSDCAVRCELHSVNRFALVTSGRMVEKNEMQKFCEIYKSIREKTTLKLCASMGLIGKEELLMLKNAGITRYHCNVETAPSFFPQLCTTHTIEQKKRTLLAAKECGLDICSGGIIGMGESMEQRIELACELRSLGVRSVPVNILNPIKGTKLENAVRLTDEEILTTIAVFRFILPDAFLRFAGGRLQMSGEFQKKALRSGINAAITGDLLTTEGAEIKKDKELFINAGYNINRH